MGPIAASTQVFWHPQNKALVGGKSGEFQAQGSKVKLMIVPTDEELSIAQQSLLAIDQQAKA